MAESVFHAFLETVERHPSHTAVLHKKNGQWQKLSWSDVSQRIETLSHALLQQQIAPGQRVGILAQTSLEWTITDLAILSIGAITVPIYPSLLAQDIAFILKNAEVSVLFIDGKDQLKKITQIRDSLPELQHVIMFDKVPDKSAFAPISYSELMANTGVTPEGETAHKERWSMLRTHDLATIVYTSGTTGEPKGAMITHDNLWYEATATEKLGLVSADDIQLLFLPLAHIFARIMQVAWIRTGHVLAFAEAIEKAVENMSEVRPTVIASVPRIYEKVQTRVIANMKSKRGFKAKLATWAIHESNLEAQRHQRHQSSTISWLLAKRLVFGAIQKALSERFGGRMRLFISGGAPLSPDVSYFFKHAGFPICEGYGLTETSAATCVNLPADVRIGTVGRPLPGTELAIADDGEILVHGRGVFKGYWKNEADTQACLKDGWFKTGDIGHLDSDGFLHITDRKKNLLVTANGKKIAPQKIDALIKSKCPLISYTVILGDGKAYLTAIFSLDEALLLSFAKQNNIAGTYKELVKHEAIQAVISKAVQAANSELPSFEQVKNFRLAERDFTIGAELTPTLKVRQDWVVKEYKTLISQLYPRS